MRHVILIELSSFIILHVLSDCKPESWLISESLAHFLDKFFDLGHLSLNASDLLVCSSVRLGGLSDILFKLYAGSFLVVLAHSLELLMMVNLLTNRIVV